tara:strand:- start:1405 stop:1665 length:261 start_codon:yes stop_codon:yes gene_type:complete
MAKVANGNGKASCQDGLVATGSATVEGAKIGINNDKAVGAVTSSQTSVTCDGSYVLIKDDVVAGHGDGAHAAPTLKTPGQSSVTIG